MIIALQISETEKDLCVHPLSVKNWSPHYMLICNTYSTGRKIPWVQSLRLCHCPLPFPEHINGHVFPFIALLLSTLLNLFVPLFGFHLFWAAAMVLNADETIKYSNSEGYFSAVFLSITQSSCIYMGNLCIQVPHQGQLLASTLDVWEIAGMGQHCNMDRDW